MKTVVKIEYRDFVPLEFQTFKFFHVNFIGSRAEEIENKWEYIQYRRYTSYYTMYEKNKIKLSALRNKVHLIHEQVKKSKPFYRFWYTQAEKDLLSTSQELLIQANNLEIENNKVLDKILSKDVIERHNILARLLYKNGFVLTSQESDGGKYSIKKEVWTLEE